MNNFPDNKIFRDKVMKGMRLAVKRLIAESKKKNDYLAFSRNGKVIKVRARDLK